MESLPGNISVEKVLGVAFERASELENLDESVARGFVDNFAMREKRLACWSVRTDPRQR
jgi:hypothetical protein